MGPVFSKAMPLHTMVCICISVQQEKCQICVVIIMINFNNLKWTIP